MESTKLSREARHVIANPDNETLVSAVSVYELVRKYQIGKLPEMRIVAEDVENQIKLDRFQHLPLNSRHAAVAARFSQEHKDPFDRLLIAQALVEDIAIVSNERLFDSFGVERIWD